jgi:transcriptional regulator with PAS, ATPase and Fis domain
MKKPKISSEERAIINTIAHATFVNPFTRQREELDRQIADTADGLLREEVISEVMKKVGELIHVLDNRGVDTIQSFSHEDQLHSTYMYLFDVYHHFRHEFDALIEKQVNTEGESCKVPFADEALDMLVRRGIMEEEAVKYFAIFYQIRRAFYFIDRNLPGESECIRKLRRSLWNNVFTHDIRWYNQVLISRMEDFSTLLLGETGTGKGTAAAAIGRSGFIPFDLKQNRFKENFMKTFIQINLSQFPETLIESELFGHTKGAFTGAVEAHDGIFALSNPHGSIFLDEIGDVSIPIQIKLLQILQEREFSPVGSHARQRFDGRVIAATNKPIDILRSSGAFRDDFFYRLCSDMIVVPSLRQRIAENPKELNILLGSVLRRLTAEDISELFALVYGAIKESPGLDYHWPGNVRELEQCVRRILLTKSYKGETQRLHQDLEAHIADTIQREKYDAQTLLADYCRLLYQRHGSYQDVARITGLDRRTVKKYVTLEQ